MQLDQGISLAILADQVAVLVAAAELQEAVVPAVKVKTVSGQSAIVLTLALLELRIPMERHTLDQAVAAH